MFTTEVGSKTSPKLAILAVITFLIVGVLFYTLGPVAAGYAHIVIGR